MSILLNILSDKRTILVFKLLLVVFLLAYFVNRIGAEQIYNLLSTLNGAYFIVVFALIGTDALLRSYNWSLLLQCRGIHLSLQNILYAYMTGGFFGTFIPSSLGVDISRFWMLSKQTSTRFEDSATSVVALNIVALLSLFILAFLSASGSMLFMVDKRLLATISLTSLAALVLFWLAVSRQKIWLSALQNVRRHNKLVAKFTEIWTAFRVFQDNPKLLFRALAVSFASHFLAILTAYTIALALHLNIPLYYFILSMPIITLSRLIPLSIAGLGAEQGFFVFLFAQIGVPQAEVFLLSLLLSTSVMSFTLTGGILYAVGNVKRLLHTRSILT